MNSPWPQVKSLNGLTTNFTFLSFSFCKREIDKCRYDLQTGEAAKILGLDMVVVCKYLVLLMNHIIIVCLKYGALTRIFAVKLFCHTHIWESKASDRVLRKCLTKTGKYFCRSCRYNSNEIKIRSEIKVKAPQNLKNLLSKYQIWVGDFCGTLRIYWL